MPARAGPRGRAASRRVESIVGGAELQPLAPEEVQGKGDENRVKREGDGAEGCRRELAERGARVLAGDERRAHHEEHDLDSKDAEHVHVDALELLALLVDYAHGRHGANGEVRCQCREEP